LFSTFASAIDKESQLPGNNPDNFSAPPISAFSPKSDDFRQLKKGYKRNTSFEIWNNGLNQNDGQQLEKKL